MITVEAVLHDPRPLTLADWDALEHTESRVECIEGVLFVAVRPHPLHQWFAAGLTAELNQQLPGPLAALQELDVVLTEAPLTVRVPDIVVTGSDVLRRPGSRVHGTEVHLAVEVISEGSARMDRVMKMSEYADAGIQTYWIVDLGPVRVTTYQLRSGVYHRAAQLQGSGRLPVWEHDIDLDLDALVAR